WDRACHRHRRVPEISHRALSIIEGVHRSSAKNAMRRTKPAPGRSQRAGTKSRDDVVALGREEVAVARTREPCTGGETSPAQHLARVEPRLRIILVWIRGEARERHEIRGRPFPHIADHLPASEGAVAGGAGSNIERTVEGEIEVGAFLARRPLAPGPVALAIGQAGAVRARLADSRGFPFGLGRKPALSPVAPGLRLVPIDKCHRRVRRQLIDFVVAAPRPAAAVMLKPVDRLLGGEALAPGPARRAPEFPSAIAAAVYEGGELGVRDRRLGNPERRDLDLVGPLLVVEDEPIGGGRAELPAPAGHLDVTSPRAGAMRCRTPKTFRLRISERLSRIDERLDVHILVPDRKVVEIAGREFDPAAEAVELMLEHVRQISEHAVAVGQVQIPAGRMGDRARIPQAVRAVEDRRTAVGMTKRPVFMEPADMPDLPEYGIDDRQHRSHQLLDCEIVRHATGACAYIAELSREFVGCGAARRPVYKVIIHEDRCYHTGSFVVTVRKPDHQYALDADLARVRS